MNQKPIRLKEVRRQQEQRITALKGLAEMFNVADRIGNVDSNRYLLGAATMDPRTSKTKALFEMWLDK
jgi:hypothetical protein